MINFRMRIGIGILLFILSWVISSRLDVEISPQWQIERENKVFLEELPIIMGDTLYPNSYLPIITQVLAAEAGGNIENEILNYCDWDYLRKFIPEELLDSFTKICWCESNGIFTTINDSRDEYSVGLMQINLLAHEEYTEEEMKDPVLNLKAALEIFSDPKTGGWENWWNCAYAVGILP